MRIKAAVLAMVVPVMISSTVLAQSSAPQSPSPAPKGASESPEKLREKKELEKKALALVDEILKEAAALRLPENRIRLQANVADLLWKYNEKRARELFKSAMAAVSELNAAPTGARAFSFSGRIGFTVTSRIQDVLSAQLRSLLRQEILRMVAQHDSKLAREFLRSTPRSSMGANDRERDEEDLQTELGLAVRIASIDPAQALQIAQESLEKGLHEELAAVVEELAAKDKSATADMVAAIMKKLRSTNLSTDQSAGEFAMFLLRSALHSDQDDSEADAGRTRASKPPEILDERTLRELMDLVVAAALSSPSGAIAYEGRPQLLNQLQSMMPDVQKYAPARAEALRKRIAESSKQLDPEEKALMDLESLIERGDVSHLAEAAANAPPEVRESLWEQVAMRKAVEGDVEGARQIIMDHFDESGQREELLRQIDAQALRKAMEAGKVEEARQLLSNVAVDERVTALTELALRAHAKDDKKAALQFLEEARGLVGERADNGTELAALLQIARTYAVIEPARSFEIIEPVIDQLNTLLAAAAVLDGFEYTRYFKDGELMPQQGQSLLVSVVSQCEADMGLLARADFDRAKAAADKFQAADVRLRSRLAVAQGVLSENAPKMHSFPPIGGRFVDHRMIVVD